MFGSKLPLEKQPPVLGVHCHINITEPGYGKLILLYDIDKSEVHLIGEFLSSENGTFNINPDAVLQIWPAIMEDAAFVCKKAGLKHSGIKWPEGISNGAIAGGCFGYYDGEVLYLFGKSGEFDEITAGAVKACTANTNLKIVYGMGLLEDERIIDGEGAKKIAWGVR